MKKSFFWNHRVLYGILATLLFLSFWINIFGVGLGGQWFNNFEAISEEMTHRTMRCAAEGDYKGGIVNINKPGADYCDVYPSQFGLQGYLYGATGTVAGEGIKQLVVINAARIILVLCLVATLLLFVRFAHEQYGKRVAVSVAVMLMLSVWLVGFADKMYWVAFVFFLPFIYSLYMYPKATTRNRLMKFYAVLMLLFLLKFLNGYEYLGATTLSAITPIIYWEFKKKVSVDYKKLLVRASLVVAVAVTAFVLAFTAHVVSLVDDFGSFDGATHAIEDRGEARAFSQLREVYPVALYNFISMQPELYNTVERFKDLDALYDGKASTPVYMAIMVVSYLFIPVITLPLQFPGLISVILESFIFWVILGFLTLRWLHKKKILNQQEKRGFDLILGLGILGIMSWHVLFLGHVFVHAHMVGISYYMPLMLWVYLIVSIALVRLTRGYAGFNKRS